MIAVRHRNHGERRQGSTGPAAICVACSAGFRIRCAPAPVLRRNNRRSAVPCVRIKTNRSVDDAGLHPHYRHANSASPGATSWRRLRRNSPCFWEAAMRPARTLSRNPSDCRRHGSRRCGTWSVVLLHDERIFQGRSGQDIVPLNVPRKEALLRVADLCRFAQGCSLRRFRNTAWKVMRQRPAPH